MRVNTAILSLNLRIGLFFKILFIYLTQRERERSQVGREAGRERERERERDGEAGSLLSREPDAGLDPRTLGS